MMSLFGVLSTSGITRGCASGVSILIVPIFIFGNFRFSWLNCWIFAWWNFLSFFWLHLLEFLCVCLHDWNHQRFWIGECLLWLACIFNLGFFLVNLLDFYWYDPLTGTLGGTDGEVDFSNISARNINAYFCVFTSVTCEVECDGFCGAWMKSYVAWIVSYVEDIIDVLNFRGKLYCVWDSFRSCFGDVCLIESIVFHGWYDVTDILSMWCPWYSTVWLLWINILVPGGSNSVRLY